VQARWDVIPQPPSPNSELDGRPALTTGHPIVKRELLPRPRSSVPPVPSGTGRRGRVEARAARGPFQVSPGSFEHQPENVESAVFSRARVFQGFVAFSPILALKSRTRGILHKTADPGCHDTQATAEVVAADRHYLRSRLPGAPLDKTADDVPEKGGILKQQGSPATPTCL
jgi:hypothetical protein